MSDPDSTESSWRSAAVVPAVAVPHGTIGSLLSPSDRFGFRLRYLSP